jgi:hypothetical protein
MAQISADSFTCDRCSRLQRSRRSFNKCAKAFKSYAASQIRTSLTIFLLIEFFD